MTFNEAYSNEFKVFSEEIYHKIKSFKGCLHLEIYRDLDHPEVFFSYSHWTSEDKLNEYRKSEFFRAAWTKIKAWFSFPAEAWSLDKVI